MKPRPELKEACILAAREVIAAHGVEQLSLRAVSRHLGVSHQAPYKHYPSRDHLLAEVMRRCFASFAFALDARPDEPDPAEDLRGLGRAYLAYAEANPLEYRLMFGTPWPEPAEHPELVQDAVHAFDILRAAMRAMLGSTKAVDADADLHALFVWSSMHGVASLMRANVMDCLRLAPRVQTGAPEHIMRMIDLALAASGMPAPAEPASSRAAKPSSRSATPSRRGPAARARGPTAG